MAATGRAMSQADVRSVISVTAAGGGAAALAIGERSVSDATDGGHPPAMSRPSVSDRPLVHRRRRPEPDADGR